MKTETLEALLAKTHPVPIPVSITIGVSGHRSLPDTALIRTAVERILRELDQTFQGTPHAYVVLSPLADGADRLVAQTVLAWKGDDPKEILPPSLKAALPMPKEQYYATFSEKDRDGSIAEFNSLLAQARAPVVMADSSSHSEAYEKVGRYVADYCDVLIAVWDGQPSRGTGGTAEIVAYAKQTHRIFYWVNARSGGVRREENGDKSFAELIRIAEYNRASPNAQLISQQIRNRFLQLSAEANQCGLPSETLRPLLRGALPHLVKASGIASSFQSVYFRNGTRAYVLAPIAVATATIAHVFLKDHHHPDHILYFIEAIELGLLLYFSWPPRLNSLRKRWIDYRYLAERMRAACFLYLAGLTCDPPELPPDFQLTLLPGSWLVLAHRYLWSTAGGARPVPPEECSPAQKAEDRPVVKFLRRVWIEDQQRYYKDAWEKNERAQQRLERWASFFIWATLAAALLHSLSGFSILGYYLPNLPELLEEFLLCVALVFPALGAALAGIGIFHHYEMNAERYHQMSKALFQVSRDMSTAPDLTSFQKIICHADAMMSHEHQGWRVVVGIPVPGPG
jgi:hypothetical protein